MHAKGPASSSVARHGLGNAVVTLRLSSAWRLIFCALLYAIASLARADIWAYIDEGGVSHFAAEQVDPRYQLFYREVQAAPVRASSPAPAGGVASAAAQLPAAGLDFQRRGAWLDRLPQFRSVLVLLQEASSRFNLDAHLLTALVAAESGFNAQAVSPKGALGLMQLMPDTALRYGVALDGADAPRRKLFDPALNVGVGARHLRDLVNMFEGRLDLALAAYNAGAGAVQRAGNQVPPIRETQDYVRTVLGLYAALRPPAPGAAPEPKAEAKAATVPPGGALGRRNMIAPLGAAPPMPAPQMPAPEPEAPVNPHDATN